MEFCIDCGKELSDKEMRCTRCGRPRNNQKVLPVVNKGGFGWFLIGTLAPIAGLVLYLMWRIEKPRAAKGAGLGAIIGSILFVVLYIAMIVFIVFIEREGY